MSDETKELTTSEVAVPTTAVPYISDEAIAAAEKAVENLKRMRKVILGLTNRSDWLDLGGKPYLQGSGVEKIAAGFGVSFRNQRVEEVTETLDLEDGSRQIVRRFHAWATATRGTREVEANGEASSLDDFFSLRRGKRLPLSEVNLENVRRKAVTNAQSRALKKALGLTGIDWDELGFGRGDISAVDYQQSKARRADRTGEAQADDATKLRNILADLSGGDPALAQTLCQQFSRFEGKDGRLVEGRHDPAQLSEKWLKGTLRKARQAWDEQQAQFGPEPPE